MGVCVLCCFFQAEDGIRDLVRSRGLGDVYKRQGRGHGIVIGFGKNIHKRNLGGHRQEHRHT